MPVSPTMNKVIQRTLTNQYRRSNQARSGVQRPSRAAQFNGGAAASIAGSPISAIGVTAPGRSAIAVQNVGRLANAIYAPSNASAIVYSVSSLVGGSGPPGGGGSDTLAGLTDVNLTSPTNGQLLSYNSSLGKWVNVNASAITGVSAGNGIDVTLGVVSLKPKPSGGLDADAAGAFILRQANSGLLLGPTGLGVGAGNGILVSGTTVALNPAVTIRWTGLHTFALDPQLEANLDFVGAVNHEITATNTLALKPLTDLRLDPGGVVAYPDSQKSRTDTFIDSVTGILGFELSDWSAIEFPPGVLGANTMGLKLNYLKVDNLFARKFTADEVRVQRGEWMLTRSYGIVETDFNVPVVGATVDVWFEEAAGLAGAKLFLVDNWIEFKTIDLGSGLVIQTIYYQVVDGDAGGSQDYIQRLPQSGEKVARQQWRLKRMSGGFDGMVTKKGETGADIGQPRHMDGIIEIPDQGVIYATSLFDADGPFIQTQTFDHVTANVPIFKNRVRMGNLKGIAGYAGETYGFAAGDDLSKLPSAGFRGMTVDINKGAQFYNTDLYLYESAIIAASLTYTYGLNFLNDTAQFAHHTRVLGWYDNLADIGTANPTAQISSWGNPTDHRLSIHSQGTGLAGVFIDAVGAGGDQASIAIKGGGWYSTVGGYIEMTARYITQVTADNAPRFRVGGDSGAKALSNLHVYVNDATINDTTGITVEQDGAGDPLFHWALTGGRQYVAGIDNSDGDKWKLSIGTTLGVQDIIIVDPATGIVTINGFSGSGGSTPVDLVVAPGGGLSLVGNVISVDSTVVRTSRAVGAGLGLTGGGNLGADIALAVNMSYIGGQLSVIAGNGLTGGGTLGTPTTLNVGATNASVLVAADGIAVNPAYAFVWSAAHTFNATPAINADLDFLGTVNRNIRAGGALDIKPQGSLGLSPQGHLYLAPSSGNSVILGSDTNFRSLFAPVDSPTGVSGFNLFERPAPATPNTWQFSVGAIKTQELIARAFVSDETRIQRGTNYIAPGYGVVQEDFVVPALNANVFVYFENSITQANGLLFQDLDYLLLNVVDIASGLLLMSAWFQTISHTAPDTTAKRQRWELKHMADGIPGRTIKKGNTILNAGKVGSGWIHEAAVAADAPFIDVGEFTAVISNKPKFTSRTRMGHLSNIVDYVPADKAWGFVTGNDLTLTPALGFSGITSDAINGTRLFNTNLELYAGGQRTVSLNANYGLNLLMDSAPGATQNTVITWWNTLETIEGSDGSDLLIGAPLVQFFGFSEEPGVNDFWFINQNYGSSGVARTRFTTTDATEGTPEIPGDDFKVNLELSSEGVGHVFAYTRKFLAGFQMGVGWQNYFWNAGPINKSVDATLHVWDQNYITTYPYDGILIEDSKYSPSLRWKANRLTANYFYTAGIDTNDGNKWKLSIGDQFGPAHDVIVVNPVTGSVTINGLTGGSVVTGLVAGTGIALAGPAISVNNEVVLTSTAIYTAAGSGLQGGGTLDVSRYLAIDLDPASGMSITVAGLRIDPAHAGAGLVMSVGVMSVNPGVGLVISGDTVALNTGYLLDNILSGRTVYAGAGLTGGGALNNDITLNVVAGNSSLVVAADSIVLNDTYVLTTVLAGRTITAGAGLTGGGTLGADRTLDVVALATGGLQVNADSIEVKLPANSGLIKDATGLYVNPALAGAGMTFGSNAFNVIGGNGITVAPDLVSVNEGFAFNWSGIQTWAAATTFNGVPTFNSAPQVAANLNFTGAERNITSSGLFNINMVPGGDLVLAPAGLDVLPGGSVLTNLGDYNRKWRSLYAAELIVQNLVAADVMATVGGNVRVGPTTTLIADLASGASTIDLKHGTPGFVNGTYIVMETYSNGVAQFEAMRLTSVQSVIAGGFRFNVSRNLSGTGAKNWTNGDAVFSTGAAVSDGFIDIASFNTVLDHVGPTIAIYSRKGTLNWNSLAPVVAIGQLESFAGIGASKFGFAAANDLTLSPATGLSGIVATAADGMKMYNTDIDLYQSGNRVIALNRATGLVFEDSVDQYETQQVVAWYDDLDESISSDYVLRNPLAKLMVVKYASGGLYSDFYLYAGRPTVSSAAEAHGRFGFYAYNRDLDKYNQFTFNQDSFVVTFPTSSYLHIADGGKFLYTNAIGSGPGTRFVEFKDVAANTNYLAGVTISNYSTGDAVLHFLAASSPGAEWTVGVDTTDKFWKIARGDDVGVTPALTISNTNAVGIGTASPSAKLEVVLPYTTGQWAGRFVGGDGINIESTSPGWPRITMYRINSNSTGDIQVLGDGLYLNSNQKMYLQTGSGQDIGINGSIPVGTSAWTSWHMGAIGAGLMSNKTSANFYLSGNAYFDGAWKRKGASVATLYGQEGANGHVFDVAGTGAAGSAITWAEMMRITAAGVGVGIAAPQGYLHIHDGVGGHLFTSVQGIAGSLVNVLTGITKAAFFSWICIPATGTAQGGSMSAGVVTPGGGSITVYSASGNTVTLSVTSGGIMQVQRTAGVAQTYTLVIDIVYQ